jgi:hypothetical protein
LISGTQLWNWNLYIFEEPDLKLDCCFTYVWNYKWNKDPDFLAKELKKKRGLEPEVNQRVNNI